MKNSTQQELATILDVPVDQRDAAWRARFKSVISKAVLFGTARGAFHGPDGFPYVANSARISNIGYLPFSEMARNGVQRVHGIAVFDSQDTAGEPVYIFTHGDLVAYEVYDDFDVTLQTVASRGPFEKDTHVLKLDDGRFIGAPSKEFVPPSTRASCLQLLRKLFKVPDPQLWVYFDPRLGVHAAFNLASATGLQQTSANLEAALRLLAWFFPRSYQLCVLPPEIDVAQLSSKSIR